MGGGEGCFSSTVAVLARTEKGLYEGGRGGKEEGESGKRPDGTGAPPFSAILGPFDGGRRDECNELIKRCRGVVLIYDNIKNAKNCTMVT